MNTVPNAAEGAAGGELPQLANPTAVLAITKATATDLGSEKVFQLMQRDSVMRPKDSHENRAHPARHCEPANFRHTKHSTR